MENKKRTRQKTATATKKTGSFAKIPIPTLRRLPFYYNILAQMEESGFKYVSSATIAEQLGIDDTQVRKDIAATGYVGRPKVGFNTTEFRLHLESFLGMNNIKDVILVGVGNLGIALAKYQGFRKYGLNIIALFDSDTSKIGMKIGNTPVYHITKLDTFVKKKSIKLAVITTPENSAQEVANILVKNNILAIWNFAPVHLTVPANVFVWNENLAASFITLSQYIDSD